MGKLPTTVSHITEAPLDVAQARMTQQTVTLLQSVLAVMEGGHAAPCFRCVEDVGALWQHVMMGVPVVPRTTLTSQKRESQQSVEG